MAPSGASTRYGPFLRTVIFTCAIYFLPLPLGLCCNIALHCNRTGNRQDRSPSGVGTSSRTKFFARDLLSSFPDEQVEAHYAVLVAHGNERVLRVDVVLKLNHLLG